MDSRKDNEGIYMKGMNQSTPQSLAVNNHLSGHNNVTSSVDLIEKKKVYIRRSRRGPWDGGKSKLNSHFP